MKPDIFTIGILVLTAVLLTLVILLVRSNEWNATGRRESRRLGSLRPCSPVRPGDSCRTDVSRL